MANYDYNIWGRWQASDHPDFYKFLRSILRPKYLLYFDGGKPEGIGTRQAAFLDMLRNDILNSDLSSSGILAQVAKPASGMNFAETVSMLDSFRMKDVTAFSRSELIGDELMKNARAYLDDKYVAYLDGAGTVGLSAAERQRLDNFIADPNNPRNVLALSGMGDPTESQAVRNGKWDLFTSKWDSTLGARQGVLITPNVGQSAAATTDMRDVYGRADAGGAVEQTMRDRGLLTSPGQSAATTSASGERFVTKDFFRSSLTSSELSRLKRVLSAGAYRYLTTGEYQTATPAGVSADEARLNYVSPEQRQLLQQYAADPSDRDAYEKLLPSAITPDVSPNLRRAIDDIAVNRLDLAKESAKQIEEASVANPSKKPNVPLPPGQRYVYDPQRKLWRVFGSPGPNQPQQYIRYVNQLGETVDEDGNRIQDGPAAGFGPERGMGGISRPTTPATATSATATPAVTPAAAPATTAPATTAPAPARTVPPSIRQIEGAGAEQRNVQQLTAAQAAAAAERDALTAAEFDVSTTPTPSDTATSATSGVAGAVTTTTTADTEVPIDWEQAASEMYPEYYAIIKSVPEIAALLKKSLGPPAWSDERFEAELHKTNWWKTTTASVRQWDTASALDPATYQGYVDQQATVIQQEALNLGIRLSDERLQKLASDSLRFGWNQQTITNSLGMVALEGGAAGTTQLREGFYGQSIRQVANQYGVTLADQTFNQFVDKIAVGEETIDSFQDYALTIAKSLYPSLAEQFDAGRTFDQVTSNYKQIAANILERDPNSINMTDPSWVQAVTYQPDPKTGEQRMMNMAEWGDYLRKTESFGYQYTTEARSRAYEVADKLANMFGRV